MNNLDSERKPFTEDDRQTFADLYQKYHRRVYGICLHMTDNVDRILLAEVIAQLPAGYRDAVILHDIAGLEHSEIAQMKGRSVGTSKSQLHKGRIRLCRLISRGSRHQRLSSQSLPSPA